MHMPATHGVALNWGYIGEEGVASLQGEGLHYLELLRTFVLRAD